MYPLYKCVSYHYDNKLSSSTSLLCLLQVYSRLRISDENDNNNELGDSELMEVEPDGMKISLALLL